MTIGIRFFKNITHCFIIKCLHFEEQNICFNNVFCNLVYYENNKSPRVIFIAYTIQNVCAK